ncbi:LuxR family transcriptional regulator [Mycobacterium sp. CBMA293]|uniref:response regulator transcription factor n=1 Tax=unclassified Mycolicibacterium TaxID=2636767 RepID=UPI0012DF7F1E|nr:MULTISPECIES: LuxR family transcriptional regulator [unclassified Mycolicibacterium]MUL45571.1 LuxR family transcriptional regulator [Mycolicibacterium sp. CBMA 360]MUL60241.1 LuxR family transcriptional regulator [Mycolicibacterium sp. CBMA 335]MUL71547.1 LuxR family transcriptional regulator [Mycolicibacterium sp. CBMA 311]MUL73028.1 LuxR family transcriptional regulator [Mycolicibacterium sp. CBMA 311]MUL95997.1 LuxR family transcriptional regulator [Mycolicibacterium sp. CBMA 230]
MTRRAMASRLNQIDGHLRSVLNLPRTNKATTLEQAIANSAATTEEVLFGDDGDGIALMPAVAQRLLMASLQAQVEARLMSDDDSGATARSVIDSIRRLKAAPSVQALERQVCTELCHTVGFSSAVLSSIAPDKFVPVTAHGTRGAGQPIPRNSCVAEQDCVKFRRIVHAGRDEMPATEEFCEVLGAADYLVAPIVVESKVLALVHMSRARGAIADGDVDTLGLLLSVYSFVYERLLNSQRVDQLRISIIGAAARLAEEADRIAGTAVSLDTDGDDGVFEADVAVDAFTAALSNRERDVFSRMVRGDSNADIAGELVVSVETVKTHVKRILRKIGAANRLEAITLYMDAQSGFGQAQ